MKSYDLNNTSFFQVVKITLQFLDYKGHIFAVHAGGYFGTTLLDIDFYMEDADSLQYNDCQLHYDNNNEVISVVLDNGKDEKYIEGDSRTINNLVVGCEIIGQFEDAASTEKFVYECLEHPETSKMDDVINEILRQLKAKEQIEVNRPEDCDENGFGDGEEIYEDGRSIGRLEAYRIAMKIVKDIADRKK